MKTLKKKRLFKKIFGVALKPRLSVFRSNKHIYCQLIDDENGLTICSSSTLSPTFRKTKISASTKEASFLIGENIASQALKKNIKKIIFDRSQKPYHGRIKSLAEGARSGGLFF